MKQIYPYSYNASGCGFPPPPVCPPNVWPFRDAHKKCVDIKAKWKDCREKKKESNAEKGKGSGVAYNFFKFMPLTAGARGGALLGLKVNLFHLSTRLYPALLNEGQLKSQNFDLANAKKAKEAFDKVAKTWIKLGGNKNKLIEAIKVGHNKKTPKDIVDGLVKKNFGGDGYDNFDPATLTTISTGLAILGTLVGIVQQIGAAKNPYLPGGEPNDYPQPDNVPFPEGVPITDENGNLVDPKTGEILKKDNTILGLQPTYFWFGVGALGFIGLITTVLIIKNK